MANEQREFEDNFEDKKVEKDITSEVEVEIVDDTPEADRGKPHAGDVEEVTDKDLDKYSDDVAKRIKRFARGYHDERRAKEAAARERDEAIAFAKQQLELTKQLQRQLSEGSQQLKDTSNSAADHALESAKRRFKEAYDAGDAEKIAEAQDAIAEARIKKAQAEAYKPLQFQEEQVYNPPQQVQVPRPDDKALDWQEENQWFGQDEEMTSFALGLHEKLVKSGVDPRSDEYYKRVDARMRQVFPDQFRSQNSPVEEDETPQPRAKAGSVVAPATRSTAPKRISLTASQVALAKRLGLTTEQYAQELMKLKGN